MNHIASEVVRKISYKEGWQLRHVERWGGISCIQWSWKAIDAVSLRPVDKNIVGDLRIIEGADADSIVKAALELAIACEIHEAKEFFRYNNKQIFDPHIPVVSNKIVLDEVMMEMARFITRPQVP